MMVSPLMVRVWRNNLARLLDIEQQMQKARVSKQNVSDEELIILEIQINELKQRIEDAEKENQE